MIEMAVCVPQSLVEPLSETLMDALGALSVSIEDDDADTQAEQALFGEPGMPAPAAGWQRSLARALFEDMPSAERAAAAVLAAHGTQVELRSLQAVPEQDWVRTTQAQFQPVEITEGFWIVPSWHEPPAAARLSIRLDPGLAFGTGTHPTTRMCLRWIARHLGPECGRVLDYGCGSGILAIAAALHGASEVEAVDIDPAAVQAAQDNAAANGVRLLAALPDAANGRYAVVLANILARPLELLAPLLCSHVEAGGALLLAGLLDRQTQQLQAAYAPWIDLRLADSEDGWVLLEGRGKAEAEGRAPSDASRLQGPAMA